MGFTCELLQDGEPSSAVANHAAGSFDRIVSTYCLDLLSEQDMYTFLDMARQKLDPDSGMLLLAGITWGYKLSLKTFLMTALWELLYRITRRTVGGCRPQLLAPYLRQHGWRIVDTAVTEPTGFPWMASEVIA